MKKHARTLIVLLAGVALGRLGASLYVHYRLLADPTYTSFCDVSETVSCEAVMTSRFGYVSGVPVAAGGAIWSAWCSFWASWACVRTITNHRPPPAKAEIAASQLGHIGASCRLHLHPVDARVLPLFCTLATHPFSCCARCVRCV